MSSSKNVRGGGENLLGYLLKAIIAPDGITVLFFGVFYILLVILVIFVAIMLGKSLYKLVDDIYIKYKIGDEMLLKKTDQ